MLFFMQVSYFVWDCLSHGDKKFEELFLNPSILKTKWANKNRMRWCGSSTSLVPAEMSLRRLDHVHLSVADDACYFLLNF